MKSKLAIWGFILSIVPIGLSFFTVYLIESSIDAGFINDIFGSTAGPFVIFPIVSVIGAILCIAAIFRIRKDQNLSGYGFAISGIILTAIHVFIDYVIYSIATGQ